MDNTHLNNRLAGLDLVRCIAALFVVSVHYFYNCGYYSTVMDSRPMFIMTFARWLFLCCVPLYMMLTGYFKCNKEPDRRHYMSMIPIFIAYIIISVIKIFVGNYYYGKVYGIKEAMQSLGNYTMAWYVGFYFSLVLIAPFLNRMWHALSRREKHMLLIFLSLIATIYPVISLPAASENTIIASVASLFEFFAPNYWQMLYPILYYFLGCYIREYRPVFNRILLLFIIIVTTSFNACISYHYANKAGSNFIWGVLGTVDCGYNCITVVLCSVSIFLLFCYTDVKNTLFKRILTAVSSVSLEIYLFSAIFDIILFDHVKRIYFDMKDYLWLFFILVPLNFILAVICSYAYSRLYGLADKVVRSALNGNKEKSQG